MIDPERPELADDSPSLGSRIPQDGLSDPDEILEVFLDWVSDLGFELFPAQEEALLELMADRHVILNTPTGSGKSLVATGLHFKALCQGKTSYYTSPIKALASEKFFALCQDFGADMVGMKTGDASINPDAPIICCTAEVLSNMALRMGTEFSADAVIMDEFHYYSDSDRGIAWQIPLISLPDTHFLLMSATLGNPANIQEHMDRQTNRSTAIVSSDDRPVPLEFKYRETPIHETVQELIDQSKTPVYIVNFTQRECAELAGNLTSLKLNTKEEKKEIQKALAEFRFDTSYGKEIRRFLSFGIGVHHAGLLPKYRLLVEQLAQKGLLKAVCGTDTLGVGVNIPIRTVLFKKLCKFNGEKVIILSVRDFKQIAGRAGRKGFDDQGFVYCQAPEHVIENKRIEEKAAKTGKKKAVKKKPPERGFVPWDEKTFRSLIEKPPETLKSQFRVSHGLVLDTIQKDAEADDPNRTNFHSLRTLIDESHQTDQEKKSLIAETAVLVRSLHRAEIVVVEKDTKSDYLWVSVNESLQHDFSLMHSLSLYLVEAIEILDPEGENYALDLITLVESILEDPRVILRRQADVLRDALYAKLKNERVDFDERQEQLEKVTHPKPNAEFIYQTFNQFRTHHPWLLNETIRPKSIGREMFEGYMGFQDFVNHYGLKRSEGVVLRYLSQLYKTLTQSVPDEAKSEGVNDALGYFRTLLARVDDSLLREWKNLLDPEEGSGRLAGTETGDSLLEAYELTNDPKAFRARIRAELHQFVREVAAKRWDEALLGIHQTPESESTHGLWDEERLETTLEPFFEEYGHVVFTPEARQAHWTSMTEVEPRLYSVTQVILDPQEDNFWSVHAEVDVRNRRLTGGDQRPLITLHRIST